MLSNYTFYQYLDYVGNDINYYPDKSIDDLVKICDSIDYCMGFNTLGWIKHSIDLNQLKPLYGIRNNEDGIYIKNMNNVLKDKINKLTNIKNNNINTGYDISFTITTCKRLNLFIQTINRLLINCKNLEIIKYWICIDDNSTEEDRIIMQKKFPFFTFIFKKPEEKGHIPSMNMLWSSLKTKYVLHFEDDWLCGKPFDLKIILNDIIKNNYDMLTLRKIGWADDLPIVNVCDNNSVYKYIYNARNVNKPELNINYDSKFPNDDISYQYDINKYWWWPGFTLNPSIYNFEKIKSEIGYFDDTIQQELFEYDYALRCYYNGLKTFYIDLNINHTGHVSSYTLNDMKRYYD